MEDIILVGGGGHCKSVIDVLELENKYNIIGIIDQKELIGQDILGYKIIGCDNDLIELYKKCKNAVITVGQIRSPETRISLYLKLKKIGFKLPVIVSPLSYISNHSFIDESSVIMHNVIVNADAKIGKNCIINTKALIEHDAVVGDNCHISTGVILNGGVRVSDGTFVGSNSTTKEYTLIDDFVKAGSVIK